MSDFSDPISSISYDSYLNGSSNITIIDRVRDLFGCCSLDKKSIYIFGGRPRSSAVATLNAWQYDISTNNYFKLKSLPFPLDDGSLARTPNNKIVFVGGNRNKIMLIYDETKDCYETNSFIFSKFSNGQGVRICFDENNNLHCVGGYNNSSQHLMINWTNKKITKLKNVPVKISSGGLCCVNNKLYLFGGVNPHDYLTMYENLWIYDIDKNNWNEGKQMPGKRADFGYHVINSGRQIIVIGGNDSSWTGSKNIMIYDIYKDQWCQSIVRLQKGLRSHLTVLATDYEIHAFCGRSDKGEFVNDHFVIALKDVVKLSQLLVTGYIKQMNNSNITVIPGITNIIANYFF